MMRGYGKSPKKTGPSIKDRIGFQTKNRGQGIVRGVVGAGTLGAPSIKSRLSGIKTRGPVLDARQKINLNKIQKGRVLDARQKLDAKRRQKAILAGRTKNLKVITPNISHGAGFSPLTRQSVSSRRDGMDLNNII